MNNFAIFVVGVVITLIAGMGVITSQVFLAYPRKQKTYVVSESVQNI